MWPFKKKQPVEVEKWTRPEVPSDDEILETAPHTICGYTNVAHGTFGYAVLRLALEGRLRVKTVPGVFAQDTRYIYERTQ